MKEVSIYIVTGIKGRWQQDGYIGYVLEYYKENSKYPVLVREVAPVQQMNENRSTLEALIQAMHRMKEKCILTVYTESKYLYSGYEDTEYVKRWKQNDWTRSDGHEIKNRDKWQELDRLMQGNLIRILLNETNAYTKSLWEEIKIKER
jgi:ribonuclease HI